MSLYARSFHTKSDRIKQKQLARSLLTMIADDIRAVVVTQKFDESALSDMMGGATGAATSGPTGATGGTSLAGGTGGAGAGGAGTTGASGINSSTTTTEPTTETAEITALPPGIYGSRYQLMVDVSRIPRSNEFNTQSSIPGQLVDVPGDVKTVTYVMQSTSVLGAQDSIAEVSSTAISTGSGLVRRSLDRLVLKYAEESGMSNQTMNSGELIAPEVVALDFAYYDGTQWVYEWDSSVQGLPWLVQINLALQSPTVAETNPIGGGISLSTLTVEDQQAYGIKVYELTVAIPGAQLQAVPSADTAAGMESVGL
jgi:hypothetical protein